MIASHKMITRYTCTYFNSCSVNFPVLAENFIGLFRDSSNKMFYFISKASLIKRNKNNKISAFKTVRNLSKLIFSAEIKRLTSSINFLQKYLNFI